MALLVRPRFLRVFALAATFLGTIGLRVAAAREEAVAPPVAWQEPAPFARLFLQLPFEPPEPVAPGALELNVRLFYSNTLTVARNDRIAVDVNVETAAPSLLLRLGIRPGWELQLFAPGNVDWAGFLARPIKFVEGLFDAVNPLRHGRPPSVAHFDLLRPDGEGVSWIGMDGGAGDAWAGFKTVVVEQEGRRPMVALRGAVKLPTGRFPYGSGEVDVGGSLIAGWAWRGTAVRFELDGMAPTRSFSGARLRTHPYGALNVGITQRLGHRAALHLQGSSHTSAITGTGLKELEGTTHYVLLGATVDVTPGLALELGVAENIFSVDRGADITGTFALRARL